jgi:carboxypeptidase C (cathepsin A)
MVNPWSWTKLVNLLVIEAPMGVGYSVSVFFPSKD